MRRSQEWEFPNDNLGQIPRKPSSGALGTKLGRGERGIKECFPTGGARRALGLRDTELER